MPIKQLSLTALCLLFAISAFADDAATTPDISGFVRIRRDEKKNPIAMETSIVHCVPADKTRKYPTVDLVSAFHVGEKAYYDELNKEFAKYDAVLYELVAPAGTRVPKGGGTNDSTVSKVQKFMKNTLKLEFQLEQIDYTKPNFVHADMSYDDIAKAMSEKGETWSSILVRMMGDSMAQKSKGGDDMFDNLIVLAFSKNRSLTMKRQIADQFDMNASLAALEGPTGSTLVSGRNAAALAVLRKQIDAGKRKIAIFYGGGHMPDMEKRLRDDFKLVPDETRWLTAWDLKDPAQENKENKKENMQK